MFSPYPRLPSKQQLLGIIRLQTAIAHMGFDLGGMLSLVVEKTLTLVKADGAIIELAEDGDMVYRAASGIAADNLGLRLKINDSLSGLCVQTGQPQHSLDTENDPRVNLDACRQIGARSLAAYPLKFGDINVGVFKVVSRFISTFTPEELSVLALLAEIIGAQVFYATKYAADDLFYRATHDEMTGLANRALFMDRLRSALLRASRDERPVGILMLDMDGLKNINDIFGHRAGDAALCAFAKRLKENIRTTDTVARIGGDEFAILLQPVKDSPSIAISMERLLAAIAQPLIFEQMELALSASVGAASAPEDGLDPETLLEKADQAMYLMKRKGKKTTRTDYFPPGSYTL